MTIEEDGARFAADRCRPHLDGGTGRYLVLLEYLSYRKDESRARNYSLSRYFLDHGQAVASVDIRGTSDEENFSLMFDRRVLVDGELTGENQWDEAIKRD